MKRKNQTVQCIMKKLRSTLPRRKRFQISPIICSSLSSIASAAIASSHLKGEVSFDSSRISVNKPKASQKKRGCEEISDAGVSEKFGGSELRRITRSYYRKKEIERTKEKEEKRDIGNPEVEISESSCVESCSGVVAGEGRLKLKIKTGRGTENVEEIGGLENSEGTTRSEVSCAQQSSWTSLKFRRERVKGTENSLEKRANEVISADSVSESPSEANFGNTCSYKGQLSDKLINDSQNRAFGGSEDPQNCVESNFIISKSGSTTERIPEQVSLDFDLTCSERLSCEEDCDYSSAFSDLPQSSNLDFSDYTPSIWCESGSQFSERSVGTSPSPTFQLFLQYTQQFCRSTSVIHSKVPSQSEEEYSDNIELMRFEDVVHEESYQMLRNRERRQVYLHDYAEEYCTTTDYGKLVIQQRLHMAHWIIEQSTNKEFQRETMFLGVNLLDRFLSNGYFKNKRNLQIAGIACLTLATRIEENQPFNRQVVRQKSFYIESNIYSRCEVVAMEWLVQKVLKFQCFLPTMYHFLWFYLKAAKADEVVEKTAKYLAVLALLGHEQLCYWPSTVAAGLVILASLAANEDASCLRVTKTHVRTKDDNLPECIKHGVVGKVHMLESDGASKSFFFLESDK
ncbi:hypothetical protein LguiB_025281 [Lonicera macranthoides]